MSIYQKKNRRPCYCPATENALGELTIEVNGKVIYTMKRDELIGKDFLKAFAHSIKEEIQ